MKRWLPLALALVACQPSEGRAVAEPAPAPSPPLSVVPRPASAATVEKSPPPAQVEHLLVPGDRPASIVRSPLSPPTTVFVAGVCSNASAYLRAFPEAAKKTGGVLAIEGDQPCGPGVSGDFHTYAWDASRLNARIEMALAASGRSEIPSAGLTVLGYSQGAALAEQLVQRWPARYARVVLIGAPTDPAPRSFVHARALVTMSCDRDVPARMKQAATGTARTGIPATYFEMPGCTHGNVTDAEHVFGNAFDWLEKSELAPDPKAPIVRIAGIVP